MRRATVLALVLAAVAAPTAVTGAMPFKAVLKAPKTEPKVNVKWWYSIKVTDLKGNPLRARLTAKLIDPIGGVHAIGYGPSKPVRPITNWPFKGTFRDYITFPPSSRGFPLKLRWTVTTKINMQTYRKVLRRTVTPG
jgi:hypothetical protein